MDKAYSLYSIVKKDKRKERFDIILEPMQAIIQLALMAFCPLGTKLSISNNLLYIQHPNWVQGIIRSFNNDKKDDLFFLFNAIIRFNSFYLYLKSSEIEDDKILYKLLIKLSKKGIDNMIQTYSNIEQPALLHTLHMYKMLLDNQDPLSEKIYSDTDINMEKKELLFPCQNMVNNDENNIKNINNIFVQIRDIYTVNDRIIISNILYIMEQRTEYYETYIVGLNHILEPINNKIKKWINDNIIY